MLALFCSCKLLHPCPVSLVHEVGTPEGGFPLSSLCSPQYKVTHETTQELILHSEGLEPVHRIQLLLSFCTLLRERRKSKGSEGKTTVQNSAKSCRGSVGLCNRAPFSLVKEKEHTEPYPCRPR